MNTTKIAALFLFLYVAAALIALGLLLPGCAGVQPVLVEARELNRRAGIAIDTAHAAVRAAEDDWTGLLGGIGGGALLAGGGTYACTRRRKD